jgi:hypothetical protein
MLATMTAKTNNPALVAINSYEAEDGKTHINIKNTGKTLLGRSLALETKHQFEHPVFGEFRSLEAFWFYIKSGCQNIEVRNVSNGAGRYLVTKTNAPNTVYNFQLIIADGIYYWLKQFHRDDLSEVIHNKLPLDLYYIHHGDNGAMTVHRPQFHRWYLPKLNGVIGLIRDDKPRPETDYGNLPLQAK